MKTSLLLLAAVVFASCSPTANIRRFANQDLLRDSSLVNAHVGIAVMHAGSGKYLYQLQADKYFVPASNTKLATCFAAMKFLGDSITALEYSISDSTLFFRGTGDPTLLHPDLKDQPVIRFLQQTKYKLALAPAPFTANRWGSGWAVGDITASYAPERSELPVYGNTVRIYRRGDSVVTVPSLYSDLLKRKAADWQIRFERPSLNDNLFQAVLSNQRFTSQEIPFVTGNYLSALVLLNDTLKRDISLAGNSTQPNTWKQLRSRPTDSLLKPLMHHSDNFFAEQTLLMVGKQLLNEMNDGKVIDTLLKTIYADLPQKPRWADGSGLSRYNLFTPQDFVLILQKMQREFSMERLKEILPTGNEGTLTNYYKNEAGQIFAKTGTLSGVVALSGFLYTKKHELLLFSVLVNNHNSSATAVRRAVERFVQQLREKY